MTAEPAPPSATVAICTRGRPESLRHAIASVRACAPGIELLVVEQVSTSSPPSAKSASGVRYVRSNTTGLSRARNVALSHVTTDLLLFTDDDCQVQPGWAEALVRPFRDPAVAVAFGTFAAAPHDAASGYIPAFYPEARIDRGRRATARECGCGGNMAVRVAFAREMGGFDEELGSGARFVSAEDVDIAKRALRAGRKVAYEPTAVVEHHGYRPYHDGSGQRAIRDGRYGDGARQARDLRAGDVFALADMARVAWFEARLCGTHLLKTGRPTGAGRAAAFARGWWDGLRYPRDSESGLFARAAVHRVHSDSTT